MGSVIMVFSFPFPLLARMYGRRLISAHMDSIGAAHRAGVMPCLHLQQHIHTESLLDAQRHFR